jgi:UDP-3-O-[3-hydroxymyristoyl] glucosamine N-acyltransferase
MARTEIGENCILHAGVVLGGDGFGFARIEGGIQKIPQTGRVIIGNDVEIGANCAIDRAVLGVTRIGDGTKIDNLVQVGHNVEVGKRCFLVAQVGVAGSVKIGDEVTIAGHTGIAGHVTIGDGATIGPYSGVPRDVPKNARMGGIPAMEGSTYFRWLSVMPKVPDMYKRLNALEKELAGLKAERAGT